MFRLIFFGIGLLLITTGAWHLFGPGTAMIVAGVLLWADNYLEAK